MYLFCFFYGLVFEVLEVYEVFFFFVFKVDFFCYLILFVRGGIYFDIDMYVICSVFEWVFELVLCD